MHPGSVHPPHFIQKLSPIGMTNAMNGCHFIGAPRASGVPKSRVRPARRPRVLSPNASEQGCPVTTPQQQRCQQCWLLRQDRVNLLKTALASASKHLKMCAADALLRLILLRLIYFHMLHNFLRKYTQNPLKHDTHTHTHPSTQNHCQKLVNVYRRPLRRRTQVNLVCTMMSRTRVVFFN